MGQYYFPCILKDNKKTVISWVYSHDFSNGLKLMEHSYIGNEFVLAFESLIFNQPKRVVWAGDYADECKGRKTTLHTRCLDKLKVIPTIIPTNRQTRFIVNHTKGLFVDKKKVPKQKSHWNWQFHPLPLLTCQKGCNGRGGGDFRGDNELISSWAMDLISVQSKKPKGFKELIFDVKED